MKNASRLKYRRSPFLVSYWSGKQLVIENFATAQRIGCDPLAVAVLSFFDRWRSFREFLSYFSEYQAASLFRSLGVLVKHSILERSDRKPSPNERAMQSWAAWNPAAGFFHSSTKDVEFDTGASDGFRELQRLARTNPMPRPFKKYSNSVHVTLTRPNFENEFPRVLLSRRTWRKFSVRPVDFCALGSLLCLTWGAQGWIEIPQVGSVAIKTSPSGGSLHPVEAYVLARNVRGLRPGLYHYDGAAHRLDLLQRGANSRQIVKYLAGQWWFSGASFVVFMTAVFGRTQWKYNYARAYRAVLMEAGHLCQTFCLTATWLGLAPFCTLAFADSKIEKALGLDGISESVLYAAGAGMRPPDERQAHLAAMGARVRWRR